MTELDNSNDKGDVSEETNDKSNDAGIGDTSNTNQNNKAEEKKYSDKYVDDLIKRKTAELSTKIEEKHKKSLEGKHIFDEDGLVQFKKDLIAAYSKEQEIVNKRTEYKSKGLTDAQLDAVQVEDVKDFDKRATELFGALLKKTPPVLNAGKTESSDDDTVDPNKSLNDKLREGLKRRKV